LENPKSSKRRPVSGITSQTPIANLDRTATRERRPTFDIEIDCAPTGSRAPARHAQQPHDSEQRHSLQGNRATMSMLRSLLTATACWSAHAPGSPASTLSAPGVALLE
jgi:hypothetical protein